MALFYILEKDRKGKVSTLTKQLARQLIHFSYLAPLFEVNKVNLVQIEWIFSGSIIGFFLSCVCYVFVRVCLYVLCGHLLGKG